MAGIAAYDVVDLPRAEDLDAAGRRHLGVYEKKARKQREITLMEALRPAARPASSGEKYAKAPIGERVGGGVLLARVHGDGVPARLDYWLRCCHAGEVGGECVRVEGSKYRT